MSRRRGGVGGRGLGRRVERKLGTLSRAIIFLNRAVTLSLQQIYNYEKLDSKLSVGYPRGSEWGGSAWGEGEAVGKMRRSWGWWRRGRGGRLRKEAAVLTSQLPAGTRLASSEGWAAAAAGWARVVLRGPGRFHPIARSVVPYALRLSTATSASSRRRSIPPEKEDEEADGEFGTRINVQGREGNPICFSSMPVGMH